MSAAAEPCREDAGGADAALATPEPSGVSACRVDDTCVTCSDAAVRVRVVELGDDGTARVDTGDRIEEVSVALVDAVVGDDVLVHAGEAIAALGPGP